LGLLSEKPHAIQHLSDPVCYRIQPSLECGVLSFELDHALSQIDARRAAFDVFDVLESGFRGECAASERRKLVREVADECVELTKRSLLSSRVV
jgi:hypothetical protein